MQIKNILRNTILNDTKRIYSALPKRLKIQFYIVLCTQIIFGMLELITIMVLSLFAMTLANPDVIRNSQKFNALMSHFESVQSFLSVDANMIFAAGLMVVSFIGLKNLLSFTNFYLSARFSESTAYHIGCEAFKNYLYQPFIWHISPESQEFQSAMAARYSLSSYIISQLMAYSYVVVIVFLMSGLFIASPTTTGIVVFVIGLTSFILYGAVRKKTVSNAQVISSVLGKESQAYSTASASIREVIIYQQEDVFAEAFMENGKRAIVPKTFAAVAHLLPTWVLETVGFGIITVAIGINFFLFEKSKTEVIAILSILTLTAWRILPVIYRLVGVMIVIRGQRVISGPCIELMEKLKASVNPANRLPPLDGYKVEKEIHLKNVSFRYPGAEADALQDVSMIVPKGISVGLVGSSGAGKSTLAGVLSGLLPPASGSMEVDGAPLAGRLYSSYLSTVGFVPQQTNLIGGTIADNVAFSEWGKPYDLNRVLTACRLAAMDFVTAIPDGHLQPVNPGGSGFSGGQMQRISIARALYAKPQILIFDEATSSLDVGNENIIRQTITTLHGEITTIIIAHRLSTVEHCDKIIWLENGKIRMDGPAPEVLAEYIKANSVIAAAGEDIT